MPERVDLERIDVFDQGVQAFRIVPAAKSPSTRDTVESAITRTESATQLGRALREQQQRARENRKR